MKTPNLPRRLNGIDAAFLYLERKEIPLHIAGVCIFEDAIPFERVRRRHRFQTPPDSALPPGRGGPAVHVGYPTWEDDANFDIHRHIFHVTGGRPRGPGADGGPRQPGSDPGDGPRKAAVGHPRSGRFAGGRGRSSHASTTPWPMALPAHRS